jgi:NADH dehydrogenase FAD-containing subunit
MAASRLLQRTNAAAGDRARGSSIMAHIVVLGAGRGGMPMACEMRELARRDDEVTVSFSGSDGGA